MMALCFLAHSDLCYSYTGMNMLETSMSTSFVKFGPSYNAALACNRHTAAITLEIIGVSSATELKILFRNISAWDIIEILRKETSRIQDAEIRADKSLIGTGNIYGLVCGMSVVACMWSILDNNSLLSTQLYIGTRRFILEPIAEEYISCRVDQRTHISGSSRRLGWCTDQAPQCGASIYRACEDLGHGSRIRAGHVLSKRER
jgi:hypothetical protein